MNNSQSKSKARIEKHNVIKIRKIGEGVAVQSIGAVRKVRVPR